MSISSHFVMSYQVLGWRVRVRGFFFFSCRLFITQPIITAALANSSHQPYLSRKMRQTAKSAKLMLWLQHLTLVIYFST